MLAKSFGFPKEIAGPWLEQAGLSNARLIRDGQDIVGGLLLIPMHQYFGGRSIPCMGIAGVVVSPSARGRGVATELMRRAMRELRKSEVALSSLYPASIPLYRRAGYEISGGIWRYALAGRDVPIHEPTLAIRAFEAADERQVRAIYAAQARNRNGWLDRGPYVWERTRRVQDKMPAYGHVFHDNKHIEGYVFYRHKQTPLGFDLRVSDMAARTPRGLRDVLSFLGSHKSLADEVAWYGGIDDPWLQLLNDRHYAVRLHHHWMTRIVDIPSALAARGYPKDLDVTLTMNVRDKTMPAQSGGYRLRVSGGRAKVTKGGSGGLELDVRTLAAIYSSHLDAWAAERLGLLSGRPAAVARAAALFAGPAPSMNDLF
jgi:predicted acetyltransferase